MGIAGAGNSGTVLATLFAPFIAKAYGWHTVFGLLMIPIALTLVAYAAMAKDAPNQPKPASANAYVAAFAKPDTLWFCILYFVTFGGFVGLSSFINTFFVDQYDFNKATVGLATAVFIVAGSLVRPIGGALADRLGGIKMLTVLYSAVVLSALGVGLLITNMWAAFALLFVLMAALGMGNGSVFQMVPQRFRYEIGVMTGIVGAAGGVGGFFLNVALGNPEGIDRHVCVGLLRLHRDCRCRAHCPAPGCAGLAAHLAGRGRRRQNRSRPRARSCRHGWTGA